MLEQLKEERKEIIDIINELNKIIFAHNTGGVILINKLKESKEDILNAFNKVIDYLENKDTS